MHRQKLLTRSCGDDDDDKGSVERGGLCSRWLPDASSSDYASDSASADASRRRTRRRGSCCFGAFHGCDGYEGDGTMFPDCYGRAAFFGFAGIGGRRRRGVAAAAAGLAVLLTVLLMFNVSSRGDRYTRSLVEIREKYSTKTAAMGTAAAAKGPAAATGTKTLRTTTIFSRKTEMVPPPVSTSAAPVLIALLNDFYFGDRYARVVPGCTWRDENTILPCEFSTNQARFNASDALA
jgi:hypothetical protein